MTGQPKYREPFEPLMPGVRYIDVNDTAALEAAVNDNTAAVFFEPVLGEGGIVEVDAAFRREGQGACGPGTMRF